MKRSKFSVIKRMVSSFVFMFCLIWIPLSAHAGEVIKVGVLLPLSGALAYEGGEVFKGFEVARIEQNKKGGLLGKQIEFVKGDAVDAKAAVSEAERLITVEGVKIIIGTFSSVRSFAASTVAERNKVIYWETGAVADKITGRGYKYLFRTQPQASKLARAAARFGTVTAAKILGIPIKEFKVAVIGEDSSYGKSVSETVKKVVGEVGAKLVSYQFYDAHTKDLSSLVLRLKVKSPDALIPTSYVNDAILLHRQMKQLNCNVKVFVGTGVGHNTGKLKDAVGNDVNGVICSGWPSTTINPAYATGFPNFQTEYKKVWKEDIDSPHPFGNYSGAWVLWRVIEKAGTTDPDAIRQAALALDEPEGYMPIGWAVKFAGPSEPNAGQNIRPEWFVEQWQNGRLNTIWPKKAKAKGIEVVMPFPKWSER
ncbi:MAG: ABC transporter substrate-binding protein [Desulfobacteraceae bacterium]|nr:ABC transporter substrate-binding protein [Desulfobacteraceae bacterium]